MNYKLQTLTLTVLFLTCAVVASSQSLDPKLINGRWNLVLETAQYRSEALADLRVEADGNARLVLLTPVDGEDGLFTGSVAGNKFLLKGQYDRVPAELDLTVAGDRVNGKMTGGNWSAEVQGQHLSAASPEIPRKRYELLYDAVWNGVGRHYYDRGLNGVDVAAVRARYLPEIKAARNDGELAVAVRRSLRELHSSNTDFFLAAEKPATTFKTERVAWKPLASDVAYLSLSNFTADDLRQFDQQLDRAMDEIVKYPSLVLDLRGNRGENLEAALAALNFLLPEGRSVAYFATRQSLSQFKVTSIDQLTPSSLPVAYIDDRLGVSKFRGAGMYLAGGKYKWTYRGRIALLVDESCAGSCELFAAAMKEARAAALVGRRTRGALLRTSSVYFNLFNFNLIKMNVFSGEVKSWRMNLPVMDIRTAGGLKIEGRGVTPDLAVEKEAGDKAMMDQALSWLRKE
ncbi:MAG TPA: S41 family peptidase [Blastocatellia bacterium]|nr:S41 family peptidase [Blastocatellia bacterium]